MAYRQVNPAELQGEELRKWYLRTPDDIAEEQELKEQARRDEFFGQGPWQEARASQSPPPPRSIVRPAPSIVRPVPETRAAYPPGAAREPATPGSFFDANRPLPNSNYYLPGLPAPLNRVGQTLVNPNMYQLGDNTMVSAQEVDRIYAEQQRQMQGADEPEPDGDVRSFDQLKDGYIPQASQLAKKQRERDATCHPNGGWELDPGFARRSRRARSYETQITQAPGLDYVVRNPGERAVRFDGCAVWDPRHQLLEAKGPGYDAVIDAGEKHRFIGSVAEGVMSQGERQVKAARGLPLDWHAAEQRAARFFKKVIPSQERIRFVYTPAK